MTNCPSTPKPFRADGGDISTGRLKEIADNPYGDEEKCWLAKRVLASLDLEPVAWTDTDELRDVKNGGNGYLFAIGGEANKFADPRRQVMLYTTPPAPTVPNECPAEIRELMASYSDALFDDEDAQVIWNACRAALLKGTYGNSPAVPDGWVMVPVEPTEDMIVNGFESEPNESFSDEKEWEAYEAMSGCQQAAHRAKLCWSAMLTAAPKPEA
ncbi:MAG: hypothetical protein E7H67_19800 [Enterobacter asburiae]|uniref:hypothetical protein n=1 Tax=Enterobacteriaceae TaxID=543 RepID=UPI00033BB0FA|nr:MULTISPECIES: hypothetical protein [Enterobacteriaceae]EOW18736.1 hypothetical protein A1WU_04119 [Escherichia coli KTE108]MDU4084746.1 hypothetical protein [Enterobacter asburiae]DAK02888.1 MAG TPA: hypothetical protein [Caudoviricetes sp.]